MDVNFFLKLNIYNNLKKLLYLLNIMDMLWFGSTNESNDEPTQSVIETDDKFTQNVIEKNDESTQDVIEMNDESTQDEVEMNDESTQDVIETKDESTQDEVEMNDESTQDEVEMNDESTQDEVEMNDESTQDDNIKSFELSDDVVNIENKCTIKKSKSTGCLYDKLTTKENINKKLDILTKKLDVINTDLNNYYDSITRFVMAVSLMFSITLVSMHL